MTTWFAVYTRARAEAKAEEHLQRQGYEVYLPRHLKRRRHARSTDFVLAPVFPRYLFVALDRLHQRWRPILSTVGVCDLVRAGDRPLPIPDGVVEEIQDREDENGFVVVGPASPFHKGEAVCITEGVLADIVGLFECENGEERVIVLLDLLGRQLRARVPLGAVAAA